MPYGRVFLFFQKCIFPLFRIYSNAFKCVPLLTLILTLLLHDNARNRGSYMSTGGKPRNHHEIVLT